LALLPFRTAQQVTRGAFGVPIVTERRELNITSAIPVHNRQSNDNENDPRYHEEIDKAWRDESRARGGGGGGS
jgi:hypothetical protein